MKKALILWVALLLSSIASGQEISLNPSHPDTYTVLKGDTLWDISAKFLRDPWFWPKVWHANPEIKNPHLIYPGDLIHLTYDEQGQPVLRLTRGPETVKWTPQARVSPISAAIPTIQLDTIGHFLRQSRVMSKKHMQGAPYVVSGRDAHLLTGSEDRFYVRDLKKEHGTELSVFREGKIFRENGSQGDILGVEAEYVGDAHVLRYGDPSTLVMDSATREVRVGDRLLARKAESFPQHFYPSAPEKEVDGSIIHLVNAVKQTGTDQVVVINKGAKQGIEVGHVLGIYQTGLKVRDGISGKFNDSVRLPDEQAGLVLLYEVFDKVSFGIVMKANRAIYLGDRVANP